MENTKFRSIEVKGKSCFCEYNELNILQSLKLTVHVFICIYCNRKTYPSINFKDKCFPVDIY